MMKTEVEVPLGYQTEAIANTAAYLVDEISKTGITGTEIWPVFKDRWLSQIMGDSTLIRRDLVAEGLAIRYRGFGENLINAGVLGLALAFEAPRIVVVRDEAILSRLGSYYLSEAIDETVRRYDLVFKEPPASLIFPISYATGVAKGVLLESKKPNLD